MKRSLTSVCVCVYVCVCMYVCMHVRLGVQRAERIAVWEGEDVTAVARRFSIQHGLTAATTERLADMLMAKKAAVLAARPQGGAIA